MPIRQQLKLQLIERAHTRDFWYACLLYLLLALVCWPITRWFAQSAHEQSRLFHALSVITLATIFLIRFGRVQIIEAFVLNRQALRTLVATYGLLLLSFIGRHYTLSDYGRDSAPLLVHAISLMNIPAYCLGIASLSFFVFGERIRRINYTVAGTFCTFLILSTLLQPLDWTLRSMAGQWSGALLSSLGQTVELGLHADPSGVPMLMLIVNQHPFHVASECNGFGVIFTSILLAVMLVIYRRRNAFDSIINIATGALIGFSFNILRITVIVLLAPQMMAHYDLMHEVVGGITYWSCLIFIWWLFMGPIKDEGGCDQ